MGIRERFADISAVATLSGVVALLAEQVNARILRWLDLDSQLAVTGMVCAILFVFVATVANVKYPKLRHPPWSSLLVLLATVIIFFRIDAFLAANILSSLERKRIEWSLGLAYGIIFGCLSWLILSAVSATSKTRM
jgi:hypothetical protein